MRLSSSFVHNFNCQQCNNSSDRPQNHGSSRHPAASGSTTSGTSLRSRAHPTFIMITETNKDSAKSLLAVSNPSLCMLISSLNIKTSHGHLKVKSHAYLIGKSFMNLLNSHPKKPNFDVNTAQLILCILVDQIRKYPPPSKGTLRIFVVKSIAVTQMHSVLLPSELFSKEKIKSTVMIQNNNTKELLQEQILKSFVSGNIAFNQADNEHFRTLMSFIPIDNKPCSIVQVCEIVGRAVKRVVKEQSIQNQSCVGLLE